MKDKDNDIEQKQEEPVADENTEVVNCTLVDPLGHIRGYRSLRVPKID